jgi:hypothetical protein
MKQKSFRICIERHKITLLDTVRTVSFPSYLRKAIFFRFLQIQKSVHKLSATFGQCCKYQSLPMNSSAQFISSRFSHTQDEFKIDPIQHLPHGTLAHPTQLKKQLTMLNNIE